MRIYILGSPGSGKTTIARKISKEYGIARYGLDNKDVRDKLLNEIILKKDWIIEGVYCFQWIDESLNRADLIFYLTTPWKVQKNRIIRRFLKRKLGIDKTEKGINDDTLESVINLLKWTKIYTKKDSLKMKENLASYKEKLYYVKNYDEIKLIIKRNA